MTRNVSDQLSDHRPKLKLDLKGHVVRSRYSTIASSPLTSKLNSIKHFKSFIILGRVRNKIIMKSHPSLRLYFSLFLYRIHMIHATYKCPSLHPPYDLPEKSKPKPIVIGHRGASYNVPEHTLASYRLALELGADYIEPDLVPTKDNVLVAVHSLDLNLTTDVAKKFPNRAKFDIQNLGGVKDGFLITDFTLDEIKTLRVRQRVEDTPARSRLYDYQFTIPTFQEILNLVLDWNQNIFPYMDRNPNITAKSYSTTSALISTMDITAAAIRKAGLYIELKQPKFLQMDGNRTIKDLFLNELRQNPKAMEYFFNPNMCTDLKFGEYLLPPMVIQCFDSITLLDLHTDMANDPRFNESIPPMIKLVSEKTCRKEEFWFEISQETKIEGIGPDKNCILNVEDSLGFVQEAIKRNLVVHPWTERLEVEFVHERFQNAEQELTYLFCDLKIHGMFFENVDLGRRIVEKPCDLVKEIEMEKEGNTDVEEEEKIAEVICEQEIGAEFAQKCLLTFLGLIVGVLIGGYGSAWKIRREMSENGSLRNTSSTYARTNQFTIDDGDDDDNNDDINRARNREII